MSIVQCYERLEQTALEIQEERERKPKYCITLWWGFDGLREGEEGVWTWISRRKKETPVAPAFIPCSSVWNTAPVINYWSLYQTLEADRRRILHAKTQNVAQCFLDGQSGADSTIMRLQAELSNVNCNIAVNQQHQLLVDMLNQCCTNGLNRGAL